LSDISEILHGELVCLQNFSSGTDYTHAIRYDNVYLMCSKKPTGSQLSLPHGECISGSVSV